MAWKSLYKTLIVTGAAAIAATSPVQAQTYNGQPAPGLGLRLPNPSGPPCAEDPLFRQLDFALGKWDVYGPQGKSSEATLELKLNSCAIFLTWARASTKEVTANWIFSYSRFDQKWIWTYVGTGGSSVSFLGEQIKPGEIRWDTSRKRPDGGTRLRQWSLSLQPDKSVRELSIGSDDDGKSWFIEYDLKWVKQAQ